jgi:hypothetical protein
MLGASASFAAWLNFTTIRDVAFHITASIFVIDFAYVIVTKLTYFAPRHAVATAFAPISAWA